MISKCTSIGLLLCAALLCAALPAAAEERGCVVNLTCKSISGVIERTSSGMGFSLGQFQVNAQDTWCRTLPDGKYKITRYLGELEASRFFEVDSDRLYIFGNEEELGWLVVYSLNDQF